MGTECGFYAPFTRPKRSKRSWMISASRPDRRQFSLQYWKATGNIISFSTFGWLSLKRSPDYFRFHSDFFSHKMIFILGVFATQPDHAFPLSCSAKTPSQLISLDCYVPGLHAFEMKILLVVLVITVSQSARFHMVQPLISDPDSRVQTATGRVQAQVEEADTEKRGPAVLVFALKDLEGLGIRTAQLPAVRGRQRPGQ